MNQFRCERRARPNRGRTIWNAALTGGALRIGAIALLLGGASNASLTGMQESPAPQDPTAAKRSEAPDLDPMQQWGQWRGPLATGVAPNAKPPLHWSEDRNVHWKVDLPGLGHSTPVVWGEHLYLTAARPIGKGFDPVFDNAPGSHDNLPVTHRHEFVVMAIDRSDGTLRWSQVVHEVIPHEGGHETGSLASASPITDGRRVVAFFGSHGLYCLGNDGFVQWSRDLGQMHSKHAHGEGASPALSGDTLVVNWDHEGPSFVEAMDVRTGETLWKNERDEVTSWSTPLVVEHDGGHQVIVAGTRRVCAYDLEDGSLIWECAGMSNNVCATPVAADGMVFVGSSYEKQAFLALRLEGAKGDLTRTDRVAWTKRRLTPYVPSPLLYEGSLYYLGHYQNVMTRVEATTGRESSGPVRVPGVRNVYASPVGASGRIYLTGLNGATVVMRNDASMEVLAVNRLDESFSASAALVGNEMFLRGRRSLYSLRQSAEER